MLSSNKISAVLCSTDLDRSREFYEQKVGLTLSPETIPNHLLFDGADGIDPLGQVLAGPARDGEEILFADVDLDEIARRKFDFDVVGHYARPDVFRLLVDEDPHPPVAPSQ